VNKIENEVELIRDMIHALHIYYNDNHVPYNQIMKVANFYLDDPRFLIWTGSPKSHQHHYGDGGLAKHTLDVITIALNNAKYFIAKYKDDPVKKSSIDPIAVFFAALYHDAGKMYDYEKVLNKDVGFVGVIPSSEAVWTSAPHKRLIHHISRSSIIWTEAVNTIQEPYNFIKEHYYEPVLHSILAHHGSREWGSPVAPKTRVAWLVHLADQMSARMEDADTLDIVNHHKGA
jgi:3'-5' exoribonuclease